MKSGVDVDTPLLLSAYSSNPLNMAVDYDKPAIVDLVLRLGADIEKRAGADSLTALHKAVIHSKFYLL